MSDTFPHPFNEAPEKSPCGRYALFVARFGENDTVFYYTNMSVWDYTEAVRASREN